MNDVYTYPDYTERDPSFPDAVAAEKQRVLGRLATGSVSHMELLCIPSDNTPLQPREVIETAIVQLEQAGQIEKDHETEATSHQNLIVSYKLTS
ncbi:hypothetical protein KDA14_03305 [Candidatus Saccharibacteria bacterium]|nr:hypothetical protein [Candidatus Saccharibacteria bacterium]